MNWLDLNLDIEERLKIDIAARSINQRSPEEIEQLFNALLVSNALQQKAINQLTRQLFKQEVTNV